MKDYVVARLIGSVDQGYDWLTKRCEYPANDRTKSNAFDLVGYWVEDYDPEANKEPAGKLNKQTNGAPMRGISLVHDRFYPIDVVIYLDDNGDPWCDSEQFC